MLKGGAFVMDKQVRAIIKPKDLTTLTDENLYTLLTDIQKTTENIFMEAWRRGIHADLAHHAMKFKTEAKI